MFGLIGIAVILIMVFGGYVAAGGKMGIILKALPFEMIMIGGAAVGAFLISNDLPAVKHTLKDIGKVFKGPKWKTADYRDLLCLLFELVRLARSNPGRPWKSTWKTPKGLRSSASIRRSSTITMRWN
jgi:chemotaxis protein MotA